MIPVVYPCILYIFLLFNSTSGVVKGVWFYYCLKHVINIYLPTYLFREAVEWNYVVKACVCCEKGFIKVVYIVYIFHILEVVYDVVSYAFCVPYPSL